MDHRVPSSPPQKTLQIYRRLAFGRKYLFAPSSTEEAQYFITNPVPHKHASSWKPIFYRGDNPKYTPSSKAIARIRRTSMWSSFRIQMGDGVGKVLENKKRVKDRRSYVQEQKRRKFFRLKAKAPKKELEEVEDVDGLVVEFNMRRAGFLKRTLYWEFEGEEYRWCGTRAFLPRWAQRWKGLSHDMKLVNSRNEVIATIQKDRWVSLKASEKSSGPPNKKKSLVGTLRIYSIAHEKESSFDVQGGKVNNSTIPARADEPKMWNMGKVEAKGLTLNMNGSHSGHLIEEALVLTSWVAIEGEHRLRHKIIDVLEEIAEELQE